VDGDAHLDELLLELDAPFDALAHAAARIERRGHAVTRDGFDVRKRETPTIDGDHLGRLSHLTERLKGRSREGPWSVVLCEFTRYFGSRATGDGVALR